VARRRIVAKTRVSELAKQYGISSKEALEKLGAIGEFAKTASSSIELPAVKKFEAKYGADLLAQKPGDQPAKEAAKPAAATPAPTTGAAPVAPASEAPAAPAAPSAPA